MYVYGSDPLSDFERWDALQEKELSRLPHCSECDDPIQDEKAYYINGEWICRECMSNYEREVVPE